jgi:hypothetical protein
MREDKDFLGMLYFIWHSRRTHGVFVGFGDNSRIGQPHMVLGLMNLAAFTASTSEASQLGKPLRLQAVLNHLARDPKNVGCCLAMQRHYPGGLDVHCPVLAGQLGGPGPSFGSPGALVGEAEELGCVLDVMCRATR